MKIHVSDLEGVALDYAVAMAEGLRVEYIEEAGEYGVRDDDDLIAYEHIRLYSSSWAVCGKLMDSCNVDVQRYDYEQQPFTFAAIAHDDTGGGWDHIKEYGPTRMVAICRAIVSAKLGDEIEIPDELVVRKA